MKSIFDEVYKVMKYNGYLMVIMNNVFFDWLKGEKVV